MTLNAIKQFVVDAEIADRLTRWFTGMETENRTFKVQSVQFVYTKEGLTAFVWWSSTEC